MRLLHGKSITKYKSLTIQKNIMFDNLKNYKIVLASGSPRRRELLAGLELEYEVRLIEGIDESYPEGLSSENIPVYISQKKAEAYKSSMADDEFVITADTIVWLNGKVLGKPKDEADAKSMVRELSGATHQVITGVTLLTKNRSHSFASVTEVTFDVLTDEEIDYYVEHYRPLDKAGAYGIQELIGYIGVSSIKGSYFNVMGLPVQRLYKELKRF